MAGLRMRARGAFRRWLTALVAIVATFATTLAVAAPAQAASDSWGTGYRRLSSSCPGLGFTNRIRNEQLKAGIYLAVYYSSTQHGTNCANVVNTTGKARNLAVYISTPDADVGGAWDRGRYTSYAGSVLLHNVGGICIDLVATVDSTDYERYGVHCH